MISWIINNLATLIISLLLITAVYFIIRKMIKDRKCGKSCCGPDCGSCHKCQDLKRELKALK